MMARFGGFASREVPPSKLRFCAPCERRGAGNRRRGAHTWPRNLSVVTLSECRRTRKRISSEHHRANRNRPADRLHNPTSPNRAEPAIQLDQRGAILLDE